MIAAVVVATFFGLICWGGMKEYDASPLEKFALGLLGVGLVALAWHTA